MKKNILLIFILIIFSIPAVLPLFNKGFFQSDDGEWMIIRFSAFHQALSDGQFPVRFLSRLNYGYGYPVANFLYPGFMYLGEVFKVLDFGFVDTIKIILGLSMVGSAIFCYLWLSKFFDKLSGFVGALFYLYTPYHLFDLYKRGSVGEVLSLAVMPFVLWQIERKSLFWTALGIGFLIISHNTLAVLFLGLIVIYVSFDIYVSKDKKNLLRKYLLMIIFGLGISSFFWISAFFDLKHTIFSDIQVSEWSKYFSNLSLIGISTFFVFVLTTVFFIMGIIKLSKHGLTGIFLAIGILSLFFASSFSSPLWNVLPVSFIQFPFRFLSITVICVAFLSAVIVNQLKGNRKIIVIVVFFVFLGFSTMPHTNPIAFFDKGDSYYSTNEGTTTVKNEYMPIWVKNNPEEHFGEKVIIINGEIRDLEIKSNRISFSTNSMIPTKATINTVYFPGWNATIDGRNASINYESKGLIEVEMPEGQHKVVASFSETPIRIVSNIISLISVLFLIVFLIL